jgi:formylglycine-generating enzyme required for sulfatase activity
MQDSPVPLLPEPGRLDTGSPAAGAAQPSPADLHSFVRVAAGGQVLPRFWHIAQFGQARPSAPVVGVNAWEAGAYCRWLAAHWAPLPEGRLNPGLQPALLRLPCEAEFNAAAGGAEPMGRCPWDAGDAVTRDLAEILRRANFAESQLN